MGYPLIKTGIQVNDRDLADLKPSTISEIINSDPTGTIKIVLENEIAKQAGEIGVYENENDWYGKDQGRPRLSELPYMQSEGDGYPRLPGHVVGCDGKETYRIPTERENVCRCKWQKYNKRANGMFCVTTRGEFLDDLD